MEAISQAGTCLGILAQDGILIAAEKRNIHKLLDDSVRIIQWNTEITQLLGSC